MLSNMATEMRTIVGYSMIYTKILAVLLINKGMILE